MLFSAWIVALLRGLKEFGVVNLVFLGGVGSVGDEVFFGCDMGGVGYLTGWLTHGLGAGMVLAIGVVAEAGVLEGMFAL